MRFALYSDLHLERMFLDYWQPPPLDVDAVILAGDICSLTEGIEWASRSFAGKRVIFVSGNHELYGGSLLDLSVMRTFAVRHKVDFLENARTTIGNVRFLGATLWSDFSLYGKGNTQIRAMRDAQTNIADYRVIRGTDGYLLEPSETLCRHAETVAFLNNELGHPFEGATVVVTHFAPHLGCIAPQFLGGALTPYFVSDLAWLMKKHDIDAWCHGHTHTNGDFVAENGCRVVSNQMGYAWEYEYGDMGFRPDLIIEV